jgi:hypothetical protein
MNKNLAAMSNDIARTNKISLENGTICFDITLFNVVKNDLIELKKNNKKLPTIHTRDLVPIDFPDYISVDNYLLLVSQVHKMTMINNTKKNIEFVNELNKSNTSLEYICTDKDDNLLYKFKITIEDINGNHFENSGGNGFRNYNWNTKMDKIKSELGEPKLVQEFQQYGANVIYHYYGPSVDYGYNTAYYFAYINEVLVGGGYTIISPNDESMKDIKYHDEEYTDLQYKFTIIYGASTTTSEFMNEALKNRKFIPDMEKTTTEELIKLSPFVSYWVDDKSLIKLSLYYDEDWFLVIDFLGQRLLNNLILNWQSNSTNY